MNKCFSHMSFSNPFVSSNGIPMCLYQKRHLFCVEYKYLEKSIK